MRTSLFYILILLFASSELNAQLAEQLLFNKKWTTTSGSVEEFDHMDSKIDSQKRVYVAGTSFEINEGSNVHLSRTNNGTVDWELSWNSTADQDDAAAAIVLDNSGNSFIAGTTFNSLNENFDFLLLKVDQNGNEVFHRIYNSPDSGDDLALAIGLDSAGNIYLTGTCEGDTTLQDICTVKYSPNGTLLWQKSFDYNQYHDIAAKIVILGSNLVVTGGSGSSWNNWEFTTIKYDLNGNLINSIRTSNGTAPFDLPRDIAFDEDGNIYVTGQIPSSGGNDLDVFTVKYDEALNLEWDEQLDGYGYNDTGNALSVNSIGEVTVLASVGRNTSQNTVRLLNYSSQGVFNWSKELNGANMSQESLEARAMYSTSVAKYVVGVFDTGQQERIRVVKFDNSGNLVWSFYDADEELIDVSSIFVDSDEQVYLTGITNNGSSTSYFTNKFEALERTMVSELVDSIEVVKGEFIITFNSTILDSAFLHAKSKVFTTLDKLINFQEFNALNDSTSFELKDMTAIKLYKQLTPLNTRSLTRQGDTIPIPEFWSHFVVVCNDPTLHIDSVITELRDQWPMVKTVQRNFVYKLTNCETNDAIVNDGGDSWYWMNFSDLEFSNQTSINPLDNEELGNVDLEDGWCLSVGNSFVRVGVFDNPVDFTHEDFSFGGMNFGINGWDFINQGPLNDQSLSIGADHGTKVAGIIGAFRNNGVGIAGIAGGDYQYYEENNPDAIVTPSFPQFGVQLQSYGISYNNGFSSDLIAEAINLSVTHDFEQSWGDAIHIMNHSWGSENAKLGHPWRTGAMFDEELANQMKFANRNGVSSASARGNLGTDQVEYPACYYDDWTMSIGANDHDGLLSSFSSYGLEMDMIAPGQNSNGFGIYTTDFDIGQNVPYSLFEGSSAATPHVVGTAALLMSYYNQPFPDPSNLYPNDIENIIEMGCVVIDNQSFSQTGNGTLRIGNSVKLLENMEYILLHQEAVFTFANATLEESMVTINLPQNYQDLVSGEYIVNVYKIEGQSNYTIPTGYEFNKSWVRPSATNLMRNYYGDGTVKYIFPDEGCELESEEPGSVTVSGYLFNLIQDPQGNSINSWIPNQSTTYSIPYSVHVKSINLTRIEDRQKQLFVIFPNPATSELHIEIPNLYQNQLIYIKIFDSIGKLVRSFKNDQVINVAELAKGIYIVRIEFNNQIVHNSKFIKQ